MKIKSNKKISICLIAIYAVMLFVVAACSTEKNTFINRTYHSTTARYNGLFNANELLRIGMEEYRLSARENFNEILPVELYPNAEEVVDYYPIIDTAIAKCQSVISKHSMPTASKPSQKKTEHAKWIDQNWFTIGYSYYIRKDYEKALKTFEYLQKFYDGDPIALTGQLWSAKVFVQQGEYTKAVRSIQKMERSLAKIKEEKLETEKKSKKLKTKFSKSKKEDKKIQTAPKNFEFELAKLKAIYALAKMDYKVATEQLEIALQKAKKKEDKARISFILGQLLQRDNDSRARDYYTLSIKKNAPFELSFNAKINRAVVSNLDNDEMIAELKKLAREERYLEFRDQIYFAMSKVELKRDSRDMAKYYLSRSVFYSLNNDLQKGISYEKLGDLTYEEKKYASAQRYYDSSAQVIPETYHNYDLIKNKAEKLSELVENLDVIAFQDSVQHIAAMSEKERENFLKNVIKQLKEENQRRIEREALRAEQMRKLQQTYAVQNQKSGSKFYFSNQKAMQEGVEDFKSIWGQRKNEDFWRWSNKPKVSMETIMAKDSTSTDSLMVDQGPTPISLDSLSVDDLLKDVPLSNAEMSLSNEKLLDALFISGLIYKDLLNEIELADHQFQRILDKNIENDNNLGAAYQLYKIHENTPKSAPFKEYILNNFPNSDYANYLRDPDYFVKKKERDALAVKDYLRSIQHFEQGLYYPVILKADKVIQEEHDNVFRKEYFLLKAMAMGQINRDKTSLLPVLNQVLEEYPDTEVAEKASMYIDLINNGVPPFEEFEEPQTDIFSMDGNTFYVLIELQKEQDNDAMSRNVSNYNGVYHSRLKLSTAVQLYDDETDFILIKEFKRYQDAQLYIKDFGNAKRYIMELKGNEIFLISKENLKTVLLDKKFVDYKKFHEKNYE